LTTLACTVRGKDPPATIERARAALDAGFASLVLEDPLYAPAWEDLSAFLSRGKASAIRLFVPYPGWVRPGTASPYRVAPLDPDGRREAIRQGEETLLAAERLRIPLILVPVARNEGARGTLDAYRSVLYPLLELADRRGVTMCLTPSSRRGELPGAEDVRNLVREFRGAPLATWIDAVRTPWPEAGTSGRGPSEPDRDEPSWMPEDLAALARGAALHRREGDEEGHLPRADGVWRDLAEAVREVPLWVLDLRSEAPADEVARGYEVLEALAAGPPPAERPLFG